MRVPLLLNQAFCHILVRRVDLTINREADRLRHIVFTLQVGLALVGDCPISQDVKLLRRVPRLGSDSTTASLVLAVGLRLRRVSSCGLEAEGSRSLT